MQGMRLRGRNFRRRFGEIDLIMQDADALVFVEVRKRDRRNLVSAADSIDFRKRRKLLRTAEAYLQASGWEGPCRFDVVLLDRENAIEWIPDAFNQDD